MCSFKKLSNLKRKLGQLFDIFKLDKLIFLCIKNNKNKKNYEKNIYMYKPKERKNKSKFKV